jgi:hypothetical protein
MKLAFSAIQTFAYDLTRPLPGPYPSAWSATSSPPCSPGGITYTDNKPLILQLCDFRKIVTADTNLTGMLARRIA